MSKLTLSVDDQIVARAKRYAAQRGISVSKLVESYLAAISDRQPAGENNAPVLRSLRGVLKNADGGAWRKHLVSKYR